MGLFFLNAALFRVDVCKLNAVIAFSFKVVCKRDIKTLHGNNCKLVLRNLIPARMKPITFLGNQMWGRLNKTDYCCHDLNAIVLLNGSV